MIGNEDAMIGNVDAMIGNEDAMIMVVVWSFFRLVVVVCL